MCWLAYFRLLTFAFLPFSTVDLRLFKKVLLGVPDFGATTLTREDPLGDNTANICGNFPSSIAILITNTINIIIANPNSPVGDLIQEKDLIKIIKKSNKYGIPFFIDQAYFEVSKTDMAQLVKKI